MTDYGNDVYGVDSAWGYFETDNATTKVRQERHYRRTYVWDVRNRLTESHDSTNDVYYVYGEDGMRTNKYTRNAETIYFCNFWTWHKDGGSELDGGKNSKHIFLGTERLVTKVNSANRPTDSEEMHSQYFYHSDHLGSAQLVTNQDGEVYQRIEYTPYGETWIDMRTNITALYDVPYRFTAKELDKETGLYYYGARYLDPKYSRWISTDPALGEYIPAAGKANAKDMANLPGMGGIFNHTNAGLFHYAGNCPVRYIDPDGRFWDTVWDLYSLGVGIKSFINNVKEGDVLGAVMDGAGIIADAAAVAMPFVPGGASCAVKTARAVATGIAGAGEVAAGAKNVYEGVRDGDTLQVLDGTVQIVSGANTVKGSAGKLAEGPCFIAGTLTLTDDGLVPIESIHKGDEVYSFIEETGSIELRPVLNTFCREVTELVIVTTDSETINTTPTHPFMTEDLRWCEAGNLASGARLKTLDGDVETVISVERIALDTPVLVYNFEVAEGHTYFVTGTAVLVHNACGTGIKNTYSSIKNAPGYPQGFTPARNGLRKYKINNMEAYSDLREVESGTWYKVYKDGYDESGHKISIHYFQSESGKVFDVKVKNQWSNDSSY